MEPGGAVSTMVPGGDLPMPLNSTKMPSPQDLASGSMAKFGSGKRFWRLLRGGLRLWIHDHGESGEVLDGVWVRDWHDEEW